MKTSGVGMDIQPQATQPISDDQELAKVLAGVTANTNSPSEDSSTPAMSDIPALVAPSTPPPTTPAADDTAVLPALPEPVEAPDFSMASPAPASDLDSVKKDAITELRPLVDKLTLAPEEKFDTYLLLIRSTDDRTLIAPAHEAAKAIEDETRRAQALLDIIKEIDFLSSQQ
ncbi:MAG: hypothetical protein ABIP74_03290 [Candidatus Saccharimonas sp.]